MTTKTDTAAAPATDKTAAEVEVVGKKGQAGAATLVVDASGEGSPERSDPLFRGSVHIPPGRHEIDLRVTALQLADGMELMLAKEGRHYDIAKTAATDVVARANIYLGFLKGGL